MIPMSVIYWFQTVLLTSFVVVNNLVSSDILHTVTIPIITAPRPRNQRCIWDFLIPQARTVARIISIMTNSHHTDIRCPLSSCIPIQTVLLQFPFIKSFTYFPPSYRVSFAKVCVFPLSPLHWRNFSQSLQFLLVAPPLKSKPWSKPINITYCSAWLRLKLNTKMGLNHHTTLHYTPLHPTPPHHQEL